MSPFNIKKKTIRIITQVVTVVLVLLIFSLVVSLVDPEPLINSVGITSIYVILFFYAIFGGVSSLTAASFYGFIVLLGGSDTVSLPIILLIAPVGLLIGDYIFYSFSKATSRHLLLDLQPKLLKLRKWLDRHNDAYKYVFIFIYDAFTPLPGDILMFILGGLSLSFRKYAFTIYVSNAVFIYILMKTGESNILF